LIFFHSINKTPCLVEYTRYGFRTFLRQSLYLSLVLHRLNWCSFAKLLCDAVSVDIREVLVFVCIAQSVSHSFYVYVNRIQYIA